MAQSQQTDTAKLAEFVRASGSPAVLSENGRHVWLPGARGEMQRLPLEATSRPGRAVIRGVLKQRGIWIATFMQKPNGQRPANCFDYVCSKPDYDVSKLDKKCRRDVRRGLRRFEIRRCTWDELTDRGYQPYADTEWRHGHSKPEAQDLYSMAAKDGHCPFIELWGAWQDNRLGAWIRVVKARDWAFITNAYSTTDALSDCPNNAVIYEATRTLLVDERRKRVSFGVSSVQVTSNVFSLHRFKIRMGFEPWPLHRTFVVHPLLRPLFRWRVSSWLWDLLTALHPGSAALSKAAGLARLLSEREADPLAWSRDA